MRNVFFIVCVVLCAVCCLSVVCFLCIVSHWHRVKINLQFNSVIIIIIMARSILSADERSSSRSGCFNPEERRP
jgi:hypothetical protein